MVNRKKESVVKAHDLKAYAPQAYAPQAYVSLSQLSSVNGQIIKDESIEAKYDGKNVDLDIYNNGEHYYSKLDKNDIKDLLARHASSIPLEKRLIKDFAIRNNKKSIKKSIKKKKYNNKNNKKRTLKRRK